MINPAETELAAALIAVLEGERLTAYQDTGGVWTNGIGNTHGVIPGSTITHEEAVADFARNAAALLPMVAGMHPVAAAAYVSFGYNCGAGALRAVLTGADTIDNPKHTTDRHGNVLPGLVARRRLEAALIRSGS